MSGVVFGASGEIFVGGMAKCFYSLSRSRGRVGEGESVDRKSPRQAALVDLPRERER
jgi:hypothetical protein